MSVVSLGVRASGVAHVAVTIPGPFPRLTDAPSREQATCARPPADARGVAHGAAGLRTPCASPPSYVSVSILRARRRRPTCESPSSYVRVRRDSCFPSRRVSTPSSSSPVTSRERFLRAPENHFVMIQEISSNLFYSLADVFNIL